MHTRGRDERDRIDAHAPKNAFPHLIGRDIEDDFRRKRRHDPGTLGQFTLELAAPPARIADEDPQVGRRTKRQLAKHVDRTREMQVAIDLGDALGRDIDVGLEIALEEDPAGMSRGFAAIESDGWGEDSGRYESADEPSTREASIPDLSPMMEQRIQETLEKVAWEAFSDLSESIVKQVMDRVEKIAWEVVPQMAETLVREEIRQMKGEDD